MDPDDEEFDCYYDAPPGTTFKFSMHNEKNKFFILNHFSRILRHHLMIACEEDRWWICDVKKEMDSDYTYRTKERIVGFADFVPMLMTEDEQQHTLLLPEPWYCRSYWSSHLPFTTVYDLKKKDPLPCFTHPVNELATFVSDVAYKWWVGSQSAELELKSHIHGKAFIMKAEIMCSPHALEDEMFHSVEDDPHMRWYERDFRMEELNRKYNAREDKIDEWLKDRYRMLESLKNPMMMNLTQLTGKPTTFPSQTCYCTLDLFPFSTQYERYRERYKRKKSRDVLEEEQ